MELVPEDTSTDWERLRAAFDVMRKDLNLYIPEEPLADDQTDEEDELLLKEVARRRKPGAVYLTQAGKTLAESSGELRVRCRLTPRYSIGHDLVLWLFNINTSFALRFAELRALYERVVRSLRGQDFEVTWTGDINAPILVRGKWANP